MSVLLLKTLIAIAEEGSFSAAADRICVSHAAVGQQMKRLEETLHVSLFDRSKRVPRLNQLGKALVPKARLVVQAYDTILDDLTGDAQFIGELSLGAVPSTIRELIPKSIKRLVNNYPDLRIRVVPGLSGELYDQVMRGALDAAVVSQPSSIDRSLSWFPFAEEELVLLTSPEVDGDDPMQLLSEMPYIRHTKRAAMGMVVEQWLQQNNVSVREVMVMESTETLSSMVAHNLGISIVPNLCMPDPTFAQLRKLSLGPTTIPRVLGVLMQADCSKSHLVSRLLEQIKQTLQ
ncbi:MAG: LysR family transcriptional regulator [Leucothrix sp.]